MNLYLVSRTDSIGYDEYDAFVCVAESEEQALSLHPDGGTIEWFFTKADGTHYIRNCDFGWHFGERAVAKYIGKADEKYKEPTVILASFNAG